jgi:hypothetical protein
MTVRKAGRCRSGALRCRARAINGARRHLSSARAPGRDRAHRLVALRGDLSDAASLTGTARVEGVRLVFAGWRNLCQGRPKLARRLPSAGGGDVTCCADFARRAYRVRRTARCARAASNLPIRSRCGSCPARRPGARGLAPAARRFRLAYRNRRLPGGPLAKRCRGLRARRVDWDGAHCGRRRRGCRSNPSRRRSRGRRRSLTSGNAEIGGTARDVVVDWDGARALGARLTGERTPRRHRGRTRIARICSHRPCRAGVGR